MTRQVVDGFLADQLGHWLAHDVSFLDMTAPMAVSGRGAAVQALDRILHSRRWRGRVVDVSLVVDADEAAASWVVEIGDTERVPMAATFLVHGGEISRLHLVYDSGALPRERSPNASGNITGTAG